MRTENESKMKMKTPLKHNQLGQPLDSIRFHSYANNKRLCVVRTLKCYVARMGKGETKTQSVVDLIHRTPCTHFKSHSGKMDTMFYGIDWN